MKKLLTGIAAFAVIHCALLIASSSAVAGIITYSGAGFAVPDPSPGGASTSIVVADTGSITNVTLEMTWSTGHTWVGDLMGTLSRNNGGTTIVDIFNRIGKTSAVMGYGNSSSLATTAYTFDDTGADFAVAATGGTGNFVIPAGTYRSSTNVFSGSLATTNPFTSLNGTFGGLDSSGTWTFKVSDNSGGDAGSVSGWKLTITTAAAVPEPTSMATFGIGAAAIGMYSRRRIAGRKAKA